MTTTTDGATGTDAQSEAYELRLRVLPTDPLNRTGIVRLRAALKILLRGFGLRAEVVRPAEESGR